MRTYKPYDLVRVLDSVKCDAVEMEGEGFQYRYIGQVISKPTPAGTVMVRRVPDDPSTMEEIRLEALDKATGKYKWVHYAVVSGMGQFPVDMLRYDYAAPVNFTLHEDEFGRVRTLFNDARGLIVARATERKEQGFTHARWASYGWKVEVLRSLKIERK